MSITISTDVFCDGFEDCSQWIEGTTGPRSDAKAARKNAKRYGWKRVRGKDYCPDCQKERPQ